MKKPALSSLLLALALISALAGCGNKGELVRPGSTPDASTGS